MKRLISIILPYFVTLVFFVGLFLINTWPTSWIFEVEKNYLSIHILLEFVGILVSFAIFTLGWATYDKARATDILLLSVASMAVGALDLGHTLSFVGMPDFFGPSGANKSVYFWLASRLTGALAFLYIAISRPRYSRWPLLQWILLFLGMAWVAFCFWIILIHPENLPNLFVQGLGHLPLKVTIEWVFILISCAAGFLLFISAEKRENMNVRWIACASLLYGMCGYFFTIYQDFHDLYNFTGHCFKAISYVVLYRAVFLECISRPYARVEQLAKEAEASSLSKSRFLANVSHEFRTPLGVITGFSDLMVNSGTLEERERGWAQIIVRNSKQLSLLIDDLLDLAKAETEKVSIRYSHFDLNLMAVQVAEALQVQIKSQVKIKIKNNLKESAFIVSDELRVRQILTNIVGNAAKFTPEGKISIILEKRADQKIEILVEDSGIGIEPADAGRLFQPFAQVSNPKNRNFGGTGLGLSLSRKLSELLGGELVLKWSIPMVGSCFSFVFEDQPVERAFVPVKSEELSEAPFFVGKKVLIAEDSLDIQVLLKNYLKSTGLEITFADNGRKAVELVKKSDFDLILMDIQMPEMDGFEATAELRQQAWQGPIIALTAHALQPERERAMNNGFNDYLVKPIKKETLWKALSQNL